MLALLREEAERTGRSPTSESWYHAHGHPSSATVARRLGGWNNALVLAGLPQNRPGKREHWTRDRIADAFLDWTCREGRWPYAKDWRFADPGGRWPNQHHVKRKFKTWYRAQRYAGRALTPAQMRRGHILKTEPRRPREEVA